MGFYADHVVPRVVRVVCAHRFFEPWRRQVCAGLSSVVLEIGFGSGANLAHLPAEVRQVIAVEPVAQARRLARSQARRHGVPVRFLDVVGGRLPLDDDSVDSALCTFTLCTVEDPVAVLNEIRRVLKPGGVLHFLEHGLSPDPRTARWQRRLNGLEQRLAGGCQLTRDAATLVRDAHFEVQEIERRHAGGPAPWSYFTLALGTKPPV
ncbi:MAG: class I SAM-dependent methyltransferase [Acidobacteriota bacterium]|nr:class I SAM-dependent methyltransferase [Acidobacteriota bacterium]